MNTPREPNLFHLLIALARAPAAIETAMVNAVAMIEARKAAFADNVQRALDELQRRGRAFRSAVASIDVEAFQRAAIGPMPYPMGFHENVDAAMSATRSQFTESEIVAH